MINNKKEFTFNYGGKDVTLETGRMAKQADGAVLVLDEQDDIIIAIFVLSS